MINVPVETLFAKAEKYKGDYNYATIDFNGSLWVWVGNPQRNRASGEWVLSRDVVTEKMGIEYDFIHDFGDEVENWARLKVKLGDEDDYQ